MYVPIYVCLMACIQIQFIGFIGRPVRSDDDSSVARHYPVLFLGRYLWIKKMRS